MDIFGILDPDLDLHENLCGSETLLIIVGDISSGWYRQQWIHQHTGNDRVPGVCLRRDNRVSGMSGWNWALPSGDWQILYVSSQSIYICRSHFHRRRTYYVVPIAFQRLKYSYFFKAYFDIFKAICPKFKFLQNEKKIYVV